MVRYHLIAYYKHGTAFALEQLEDGQKEVYGSSFPTNLDELARGIQETMDRIPAEIPCAPINMVPPHQKNIGCTRLSPREEAVVLKALFGK